MSVIADDDDSLRERLVRFGTVLGSLDLLALGFRLPGRALRESSERFSSSIVWHALAAAPMLVLALLCRYGIRSRRALLVLDAVALPGSTFCYGMMGRAIVLAAGPSYFAAAQLIVILATTYGVLARAIYVPSSGLRTALVAGACFPGVVMLELGQSSSSQTIASDAMWWTMTIILATLASNVIFGLQREVRTVRQYGQYVLEERLGEGGMGIVYQASHAMLRRPTALKLLPPDRTGATSIARFEKEVRLTARLNHPNTVTIFDYGRTPEGVFYYAMELLDGETLEDIVAATGPLPIPRVVRVARQVASALAEAHALGLVHRDIKPANIMLCAALGGEPDVAKVLDFGLVRDQSDDIGGMGFAGTPLYMSPEAITDPATVSDASDIYAMGAVLYFLLVGEPIFEATTTVEICASQLHSDPIPPSWRTKEVIPEALETIVLACLAKQPDERPRSARELAIALAGLETEGGCWEVERTTRWWEEHRPAIRSLRRLRTTRTVSHAASLVHRTLAVDFVRR